MCLWYWYFDVCFLVFPQVQFTCQLVFQLRAGIHKNRFKLHQDQVKFDKKKVLIKQIK